MQTNVLGICGSQFNHGNTEAFLSYALNMIGRGGAETEMIPLAGKQLSDCQQCNQCIRKQETGRFCILDDDMTEIYPKILKADAIILASPANFGRLSVLSAIFLNRLRAFIRGNLYKGKLRNKIGAAMCVGWMRNAGIETTLLSIVYAFLSLEMIVASAHDYGTFYGSGNYSSREGTAEFIKQDRIPVLRNTVGMQSAELLGLRVMELAKIVKEGAANQKEDKEKGVGTNEIDR